MFLRMVLMLLLLGAGLGGLFYWKIEQNKAQSQAMAQRKQPPVVVEVETARREQWTPTLEAIGTLSALNGIALKAETAGRIKKLGFESGSMVEKGSLLVQLDDSVERAELRSQQARLKLAELDFQRDNKLSQSRTIAESTLDQSRASLEEARAEIARIQAIIEKKQIRAPFGGKLGIRQVDIGEYLQPGQAITSLQSLHPLYVDFVLPEKYLPELALQQPLSLQVEAFPEEKFEGRLSALDAEVDPRTRNIKLQGTTQNPEHKLLPGMFARVSVLLPGDQNVVSIRESAINYSLYGDAIFVIKSAEQGEGLQVERRYVKTGRSRDGRVAILDGVEPGEKVVTAGGLKLRDGARVALKSEQAGDTAEK